MPELAAALTQELTGRYDIEREIGRGVMATVFLARDLRHDRHVALKVLDPELGAVLGSDRFLTEIRTTARLQHPNLPARRPGSSIIPGDSRRIWLSVVAES
jgi:serine/threonine-protein kinase